MQETITIEIPDFDSIIDVRERINELCSFVRMHRNALPKKCFELAENAYALSVESNYRQGEATALMMKGYQHWHVSEIEDAIRDMDESLAIQYDLEYYDILGDCIMMKAMITWGKGNYEEAFTMVYDATKLLEKGESVQSHAMLDWALGVFHYDLKEYSKSLIYYQKALPVFKNSIPFDANTTAYSLIGIGCCHNGEGRDKMAMEHFQEALRISIEASLWMQEARCYYEIGLLAFLDGNLPEAKEAQQKCYSMRKMHGTKPGMVSCLMALADIEVAAGNLAPAMNYMKEALGLAVETQSKPKIYQSHEKLSKLYKQAGKFEEALEHNELFHEVRSEVVGEEANNKLKDLETKYATEKIEREAEIERLRNVELKKAHDIIAEKNKEIIDSIRYAKRIQTAMLPSSKLLREYLNDGFVLYKPKDIVAGDFYWLETEGDNIFFTAADCTGHGVPGAMVSVMCSNALTKAVKELNIHQPSKILDKTVELLEERFARSEEEVMDGMDLALCCLNRNAKTLEYAGANNPLYLIRNGEFIEFKPDKQPIGQYAERYPFTNHTIKIEQGDCFYIFSDGFADQFGGPNGKKFMYKPFKELLIQNYMKPMAEQQEILNKTIENWQGKLEQVDDICIFGLRI